MVSPINYSSISEIPIESSTTAVKATIGVGSSSTTMQSAGASPFNSNPFLKCIWNHITRFCIVLCGIFIACKGIIAGNSTNNNTFLTWLNQSKYHFKGARGQNRNPDEILAIIIEHYKASNSIEEFFKRVDGLVGVDITGKNAECLKLNFSLPTVPGSISHNASAWSAQYRSEKNDKIKKKMYAEIFQDTKRACKNGFIVDGNQITFDVVTKSDIQNGTKLYSMTNYLTRSSNLSTEEIKVINGDTIDVALELKNEGYNPVAMNMANENHPGGGVERGAAAQEESLFRRSNYHESLCLTENPHLKNQMPPGYHIPERGVVYSPDVQVFRASEKKGFAFIAPKTISFIAVAAYNLGSPRNKIDPHSQDYAIGMKEKIKSFLRVAYFRGHDAVVLGALGCGAFKNDPKIVAQFFKEVLQENEFAGRFKKIVFAVIDDHNGTNFQPFSETLQDVQI